MAKADASVKGKGLHPPGADEARQDAKRKAKADPKGKGKAAATEGFAAFLHRKATMGGKGDLAARPKPGKPGKPGKG